MSSAEKFYDHANEHFGWAETARTERERAIFLQMVAAWLEVAQSREASTGLHVPQLRCEQSKSRGDIVGL
jgi:hypothetical protein